MWWLKYLLKKVIYTLGILVVIIIFVSIVIQTFLSDRRC